jgi:hypothetical protein
LLTEKGRAAVEASERYADGESGTADLEAARRAVGREILSGENRAGQDAGSRMAAPEVETAVIGVVSVYITRLARQVAWAARRAARSAAADNPRATFVRHGREQCALLRDLFGNPFQPVSLDPSWLSWQGGTIPKLAQSIYEDRAYERLPILADALEEAGCVNENILNHCRKPDVHVRGCWVVDLLLDKK